MIVMADHSQASVEDRISLGEAFAAWKVRPAGAAPEDGAEIAVCPAQRSAWSTCSTAERRERAAARAESAPRWRRRASTS